MPVNAKIKIVENSNLYDNSIFNPTHINSDEPQLNTIEKIITLNRASDN
jgi:hypothetical protein